MLFHILKDFFPARVVVMNIVLVDLMKQVDVIVIVLIDYERKNEREIRIILDQPNPIQEIRVIQTRSDFFGSDMCWSNSTKPSLT